MRYTIDKDRKLVGSTAYPILRYADVLEHQKLLLTDDNFQATFSQFADFSNVKEVTLTTEEIRKLAQRDIFAPGSRRAAYAPTPIPHGVLRLFIVFRQLYSIGDEHGEKEWMHVFDDRRMAIAWLLRELDMLPLVAA
jgi:hypothetical protein